MTNPFTHCQTPDSRRAFFSATGAGGAPVLTRAGRDDIPALIRIRLAYLREAVGALSASDAARTEAELAVFFDKHIDGDLHAFVAKDGTEIVAAAFLMLYDKPFRPDVGEGRYGVVYNVITEPAYRGRGLASQLVAMLLEDARAHGAASVQLNATPAGRPIYKRLGFVDENCSDAAMVYTFTGE